MYLPTEKEHRMHQSLWILSTNLLTWLTSQLKTEVLFWVPNPFAKMNYLRRQFKAWTNTITPQKNAQAIGILKRKNASVTITIKITKDDYRQQGLKFLPRAVLSHSTTCRAFLGYEPSRDFKGRNLNRIVEQARGHNLNTKLRIPLKQYKSKYSGVFRWRH